MKDSVPEARWTGIAEMKQGPAVKESARNSPTGEDGEKSAKNRVKWSLINGL